MSICDIAYGQRLRSRLSMDADTGCMVYTGPLAPNGYGILGGGSKTSIGRQQYAHRAAYLLWKGPIPEGAVLDHLCCNRACCNTDHLEAVTQRENLLRGPGTIASINSAKTHCLRGHELTGDNLYIGTRSGKRECRVCRATHRASYARKKATTKS